MSDHIARRGRRTVPTIMTLSAPATIESGLRAEIARLTGELEEASDA